MKSLLIFLAIFLGLIFSERDSYSFLIKYIIMVMLFFSFLEIDSLAHKYLYLEALKVFLLMVIIALFFYAIITVFYLRNQPSSPIERIVLIALISLTVCIVSFTLGRITGGARYSWESSQSLGQKNTMFMVWISLEFLSPVTTLGSMFYVLYQNLYNSYLIFSYQKNSNRSSK